MTPQKKRTLIITLLVLSILTVLVYAFPKMLTGKSFTSLVSNYSLKGLNDKSGFGNQKIISFFQDIASKKDKQFHSLTEVTGLIDGSLLGYASGSVLSGALSIKTNHLIKPSQLFESIHYQLDGVTALMEDNSETYNTLFNVHGDSLSYENISYGKLDELDLIQEGESLPTILLWQSLLNHYKDTWISTTETSLSFNSFFENVTTSIRMLEITKDETYVELEGPLLQFSGTILDATDNFSGSFALSGTDITGTITSLPEIGTYEVTLQHKNEYQASFDGVLSIAGSKFKTLFLVGTVTRPAGITMDINHSLEHKKTGTIKKKIAPKEFIDYETIETNVLGL